ncbi:MAG TPA: neutral zinc metallopeptidase [Thermoanaerobaculia bacterium]|nr:neutral zinc metallopeptidase [Thermoanaerobaculia bacterium]
MKWTPRGRSANLDDLRGSSAGGFGGALPKMGIGGFIVLLLLSFIFKRDFFSMAGGAGDPTAGRTAPQQAPVPTSPEEEKLIQYVSFVLDDTQETWSKIFANEGQTYQPARLAIFTDAVRSGCGVAQTAMGPFYCPPDQEVYIDLGFYNELRQRFGAPGDFAQAYVIAHEIGHHVQHQLGISDQVRQAQERDPDRANELSVRQELQADCLAGVWAHSTSQRDILDPGDVEEALGAAAAVGDDRIQRQATGEIQRETWTHGSSEQRMHWFQNGFQTGEIDRCDTFAAR